MIRLTGKFLIALSLLLLANITSAQLVVTVDRQQITEADLLRLTILVDHTSTALNPDFSVLEKDFEIIALSGPNRSNRMTFSNGRRSTEVYVSWELRLRARHLGNIIIPSFQLAGAVSNPIQIRVVRQTAAMKRQADQHIFFETSVDRNESYVQGQILYTIKLYYLENISGDFPGAPEIADAVVETIENERRYDTTANGRRYYVLEKSYAIYPQKSGDMIIPRQTFSGSKVGRGFFSSREPVMTISQPHVVVVKPKPTTFKGTSWLPAKRLSISESWSLNPPAFKVGEPINRMLSITADGLAASLLPPFDNIEVAGAKTYKDPAIEEQKTSNSGIVSTRTTTIGIVPTRQGTITIPEISIPWWNTVTDSLEIAVIPAATFEVAPAETSQATDAVSFKPAQEQTTGLSDSSISDSPVAVVESSFWKIVAGILTLVWLTTLALWFRQSQQKTTVGNQATHTTSKSPTETAAFKQLKQACQANDPSLSQKQLFLWGKIKFPTIESTHELVKITQNSDLDGAIRQLERCLYTSTGNSHWDGRSLLQAVDAIRVDPKQHVRKTSLIGSLNPA